MSREVHVRFLEGLRLKCLGLLNPKLSAIDFAEITFHNPIRV